MSDEKKLDELRQAFSTGGDYESCDARDCGHAECEAGRYVLAVVGPRMFDTHEAAS